MFIVRQELILYGNSHCHLWHSTNGLPKPGCKCCQQMQSCCSWFKLQKAIQPTFFSPRPNQDRTSVLVRKIPFIVTGFPYQKPSGAISVQVWLNGPRDFDLSFMQVWPLALCLVCRCGCSDKETVLFFTTLEVQCPGSYTGLARPRWSTKKKATFWPPNSC